MPGTFSLVGWQAGYACEARRVAQSSAARTRATATSISGVTGGAAPNSDQDFVERAGGEDSLDEAIDLRFGRRG